MTPEQRFARWVRRMIVLFVLLFAYFVLADTFLPLTPQARVLRPVTPIAPEVGGRVTEVAVANNARVEAGEVLYRLDPEPFRLAVEKAELALAQARRENAELDAALAAARAEAAAAHSSAEELAGERRRVSALIERGSVSRQRHDDVVARARAAQATLEAARARVEALEVQRGRPGDDNLRLRQARNALAAAHLDLEHTTVRAPRAGRVGNLQLTPGDYLTAGSPALALVDTTLEVVADFREKSLRRARPGDTAWVALDARPGRVFEARLASFDAGVREGQLAADGRLAAIPQTDRWVRDAQRQRLHLTLEERPAGFLPTGARATVQLAPAEAALPRLLARLQIGVMSWLHHVY